MKILIVAGFFAAISTFAADSWIDPQLAPNPLFPPCSRSRQQVSRPAAVDQLIQQAILSESNALIIIKDRCTLVEKYFGGRMDERFSVQSVTKSVASLAIGQLVQEKKIQSLDVTIASLFPSLPADPQKRKITLRHLLSQTSGIPDWNLLNSRMRQNSVLEAIWATPLLFEPGTQFHYSSMATYVLGPVIEKLAGQGADPYIQQHVLLPLGIHSGTWSLDGSRVVPDLAGGLNLIARDMIPIGQTMLDGGRWQGRQIFSPEWLNLSFRSSQPYYSHYGFLWWLYDPKSNGRDFGLFSAVGYQGQFITIDPSQNLVAIRIHRFEDTQDPKRLQKIYLDLPPAVLKLR